LKKVFHENKERPGEEIIIIPAHVALFNGIDVTSFHHHTQLPSKSSCNDHCTKKNIEKSAKTIAITIDAT
jgi:hypothetical protein